MTFACAKKAIRKSQNWERRDCDYNIVKALHLAFEKLLRVSTKAVETAEAAARIPASRRITYSQSSATHATPPLPHYYTAIIQAGKCVPQLTNIAKYFNDAIVTYVCCGNKMSAIPTEMLSNSETCSMKFLIDVLSVS